MFKIFFTCLLTCPGDLSDDAGSDLAFMDGEQLEDDEELRLHIHGCNSFFTKWAPQYDTIFVDYMFRGMHDIVTNFPNEHKPGGTSKVHLPRKSPPFPQDTFHRALSRCFGMSFP